MHQCLAICSLVTFIRGLKGLNRRPRSEMITIFLDRTNPCSACYLVKWTTLKINAKNFNFFASRSQPLKHVAHFFYFAQIYLQAKRRVWYFDIQMSRWGIFLLFKLLHHMLILKSFIRHVEKRQSSRVTCSDFCFVVVWETQHASS